MNAARWLVGLAVLAGAWGCSRVLGIEEATLGPEPGSAGSSGTGAPGGASAGAAGGGRSGAGGAAGSWAAGGSSGGYGGTTGRGGSTGVASCPAGATPAAGGVCNVSPACGCAAGQVCYPDKPETGLQCLAANELAVGQSCSGKTCAAGAGCFGSVCKPYCQTDADCTAVGGLRYCRPTTWSGTSNAIPGVNVCALMCDPARPQSPRAPLRACPTGSRCAFANDSRYSDCAAGGTAVRGQPCPNGNECSPGHYCTVRSVCNRACANAAADCPSGEACLEFTTPVSLAGLKVGYCGNCDPARPDAARSGLYGCPSGYTCVASTGGTFDCLKSTGSGGEGEPCANLHTDCRPGYYCTASRTCHRFCADATDCSGGTCIDFSPPLTPSGLRVAACSL